MQYQFLPIESEDAFILNAVEWITHAAQEAIASHGHCTIGLSGGSTPRVVYEALGEIPLDWKNISIFLIDERHTPPTHADSNQKLIRDTLLKNAQIPAENLLFPDTTKPIDECVAWYEDMLLHHFSKYPPDIAIFGMGDDGHIASLFPPLTENMLDDGVLVLHTTTDQFAVHDRISVSLQTLCVPAFRLFLLKGDKKKEVWDTMIGSKEDEVRWPAKRIIATGEVTVLWYAE